MSIIHRYILQSLLRNLALCMTLFASLFLVIDFFDRIDNIVAAGASFGSAFEYFLFKIPLTLNLMVPLAFLVATLFTLGTFAKNSELTAMRAAGLSTFYLARPIYIAGLTISLLSIVFNETVVPLATRRVKEIYNIDIQKKDERGTYSKSNYWGRKNNRFINLTMFDSRTDSMMGISVFNTNPEFEVTRRTNATRAHWIDETYGWTMKEVTDYRFTNTNQTEVERLPAFPLATTEDPESFYSVETDADTMSYRSFRKYVKRQAETGVATAKLQTDLYAKIAFPFITFIASFVSLTFAIRPARSGSLAMSFVAGLVIGFSYYVLHSYAIAMGRAEILEPAVAAWLANFIMLGVGSVLYLGVDSPS
jgi:lipopolysaccharide export system permease protein